MLRALAPIASILVVACSEGDPAGRPVSSAGFVPEEVEVRYQEREALRYAIDRLEQEERANAEARSADDAQEGAVPGDR